MTISIHSLTNNSAKCVLLFHSDDHGFSPLHWAAKEGHLTLVTQLIQRGARVNATNMGDDTPLHLAAAHGHLDIVRVLLKNKADINFVNEHGNTALHYACFWGYTGIAEELVSHGALVSVANKYGEIPLDKCSGTTAKKLHGELLDFPIQPFSIKHGYGFFFQKWLLNLVKI